MGKVETYTKNRMEGLAWALKIIDGEENPEKGVEMLRREVRFRKAVFMPLEISRERIRDCSELLAGRIMNAMLITTLKVLEEEYDWRKVRLQRFAERFMKSTETFFDTDPMGERYIWMSDYAAYFKETYGIEFTEEAMDQMLNVEAANKEDAVRRVQFDRIERILKNSYPEALEYLKKQLG